jgi:hypothetical protein
MTAHNDASRADPALASDRSRSTPATAVAGSPSLAAVLLSGAEREELGKRLYAAIDQFERAVIKKAYADSNRNASTDWGLARTNDRDYAEQQLREVVARLLAQLDREAGDRTQATDLGKTENGQQQEPEPSRDATVRVKHLLRCIVACEAERDIFGAMEDAAHYARQALDALNAWPEDVAGSVVLAVDPSWSTPNKAVTVAARSTPSPSAEEPDHG